MKKFFLFSTLILVSSFFAQGQDDDKFDYGREFLFGLSTSTNSGLIAGGFFRYSEKISEKVYRSYGIEIANIRHPQEKRAPSPTLFSSATFYEGKEKYLISTRLMYGYDFLLFKKAEQKGVQINGVLQGGPTIGLVSPYYLRYEDGSLITYEEYLDTPSIIGPAGYLAGINEMEAVLGINARASLLFEFGSNKSKITGFEVGFLGELFSRTIEIAPLGTRNYQFYPAAFISLLFGKRK